MGKRDSWTDDKWEFYTDKKGEWRWRRTCCSNGQVVGSSHEGYVQREDCEENAERHGWDKNKTCNVKP